MVETENWRSQFEITVEKLIEIGFKNGGILIDTPEVTELTDQIQNFENSSNELSSKENIKKAIPYAIEEENMKIVFDENSFQELDRNDKLFVIAYHGLKITGYFFMGTSKSEDFKKDFEILEVMKKYI